MKKMHNVKNKLLNNTCLIFGMSFNCIFAQFPQENQLIKPLKFNQVKIIDKFWSPKLKVWNTKTVYDVFDKLEGKYIPDPNHVIDEKEKIGQTRNAFLNFDLVAAGKINTQSHDGPPWYDGLVYETIRGAADLLIEYPNKNLEQKIDAYIDRIAAAQAVDADGYLNTYTTLVKPNQRWGTNGGDDKWQHDIYNSGMLMEAAVHYYKASGKTKLLNVAVKLTNFICKEIGPAPKLNVIPGHGGPEEALLKFYQLFKDEPALKNKISAPVKEDDYLKMVKFWIEQRGNYGNIDGTHKRNSDSSYNQDHMPVLLQKTIEGHAVRATLLATGVTATALETKDKRYRNTANNYWNNMIGKRMFITGGEGAIANGERFGEDFYLPESAYLETCAAIGAGFFSEQMNELEADGKYMDEFERILYNNMLSGVSLDGDQYFYENPLIGNGHKRWTWHGCPCCPPMFLKMIGSLPQYIYGQNNANVFVNLFIGSQAILNISNTEVTLNQTGTYPWNGNIKIEVSPKVSKNFTVNLRIPGWAMQKENPFDLYRSKVNGKAVLKINGKLVSIQAENGYAIVNRLWKKGDIIDLILPMSPRIIEANEAVNAIKGKVALASGPIVYCLESVDNPNQKEFIFNASEPLKLAYTNILDGINTITGLATDNKGKKNKFMAIPFYAVGNRELGAYYQVWLTQNH